MNDPKERPPVPESEVPEIIEEAFEIEKPNASISVLAEPAERSFSVTELQDIVSSAVTGAVGAYVVETEERKSKKHTRKLGKRHTDTRIDLTKWVFALKAFWTVVVAFCIIASGFALITLHDNVLLALIATVALSQLTNLIAKWWFAEKSEDNQMQN